MSHQDLVSAEWLQAHLNDPGIRVVDIRGYVETQDHGNGRQTANYRGASDEYAHGHIAGSLFVDWTHDITDPDGDVKAQIAPPGRFRDKMQDLGISDDTLVVVVDHTGGHFATRLWWALKYYGHDQVAILDGGYARWDGELTSEVPQVEIGSFTPKSVEGLRSEAADVLTLIDSGARQIVDARDEGQYSGTTQRGSRGGHIPTAKHLPAKAMFNAVGTWKSPQAIRQTATEAGVDLDQPVTAYCNGGVTATAVLFGLHRAGHADLSNYDGSWNEWGERQDLPVEANRDLWSNEKG